VDYVTYRGKYFTMDQCHFPESKEVLDTSSNSLRNIRIINPSNRQKRTLDDPSSNVPKRTTHSRHGLNTQAPVDPVAVPQGPPPPYKVNSPNLIPGNDPPTKGSSSHTKASYHTTPPKMNMDGTYINMNMNTPPIQFWGASNLVWKQRQRMDPNQDSIRSNRTSHSVKSHDSSRSRRTGGPPDDSPSNSGHTSRSILPRSRREPKVRSALSEKVQWDGQCSSFRTYKLAITGHLMQVGAAYMVNQAFHYSYMKYLHLDQDYLESEDFRIGYPDVGLRQARLDRTYLYGYAH
jgi:hypothetical protein